MKTSVIFFLLLLPVTVFAQNYGNMNKADMQNMMQAMQEVQKCMAGIDEAKLNELKKSSEQTKEEIDTLCAQGKRDKAQQQAMAFGRKMASDPTIEQMRKCGEIAQGALPMTGMADIFEEKDYSSRHVCDN